jgi:predicted transcriptional regulator
MNRFIKWIKNFLYQDIVIVENCKNSKIIINGKVIFDDTKDE